MAGSWRALRLIAQTSFGVRIPANGEFCRSRLDIGPVQRRGLILDALDNALLRADHIALKHGIASFDTGQGADTACPEGQTHLVLQVIAGAYEIQAIALARQRIDRQEA